MTGWGRAGEEAQPPLVPCPLFALLDLGVRRVGRWSCLTQRVCACEPAHVCLRACVYVCVCARVCLSDSPWTWGSRGQG